MAKNRYDSKRVFRRKPGGPWYAWLYEIDAHGVRQRTRFSTGQLDKQAAIAVLVDRERAAAQAPHGLATDAAGRTVADALEYLLQFSRRTKPRAQRDRHDRLRDREHPTEPAVMSDGLRILLDACVSAASTTRAPRDGGHHG
jgi:hypothetical protein